VVQKRGFAVYRRHEPVLRLRPPLRSGLVARGAPTANERFKLTFAPAFRVGLFVALSAHYVAFNVFPTLRAAELPVEASRLVAVDLPPRVDIPRPPEPVSRPARPRVADLATSDLTIAPTTFESFDPVAAAAELAPPPVPIVEEKDRPVYIPFEVPPRLKNEAEMLALLEATYPASLRNAGIGGSVRLWLYVDELGVVRDAQVDISSGFEALDVAAQAVARAMRFTPALMRDRPTPVWISQPIEFVTK